MRVALSWLVEVVPALSERTADEVAELLTRAGVEVDEVVTTEMTGPLVVGEVRAIEELAEFKKPIRYCQVDVGESEPRGIVCGAQNFAVGDRVVVALPGAVLPGDFAIAARTTYGHVSDGMICSARELALGDDHSGIMVLAPGLDIGADAVALLGLNESVLVTEPTPDRGYQLSVRGLARELAALLDVDFADPAAVDRDFDTATPSFGVVIDDPTGCDRFTARVVRGFDPTAASPLWLQSRLARAGMRSISLAVDVTNYVMLLLGQPMHAYDLAKLAEPITVRRARAGERLTTLDGVDRALDPDDLLITDAAGIHGLAGVMGGAAAEVTDATTDILLEAAHFDPRTVSRAMRRHALLSEAGRRFERGVDPQLPLAALAIASRLLVEHGGGTAAATASDVGIPVVAGPTTVDPAAISRLIGVSYSAETVKRRLGQVGCVVEPSGQQLSVAVPTWRPDLLENADFAEEVARLEGYDHIPPILPKAAAGRGLTPTQRRRRAVSRALAYAGCVETPSLPFQSAAALDALRLPADDQRRRLVAVANPISAEQSYLRSTLLPGLLDTLARNVSRGLTDLALYETGAVFREPVSGVRPAAPDLDGLSRPSADELAALDAALPQQGERVALAMAGAVEPAGWWGSARPASWSDVIELSRVAVYAVGAVPTVRADEHAPWHPGRSAAIEVDGVLVGHAGELHPAVCEAFSLPRRSLAAELDLAAILAAGVDDLSAPAVSTFPPATQDVALVVDAVTPVAEVERALWAGAGELAEDIRLFDVYTGDQVGAGRKSLAYALRFRASDRTLTVEDATAARDAAVAEANRRTGAVLRS